MTLIVALKGKIGRDSNTDAIIIASDTQVTSDIKQSMQKVFQLGSLPILVGGSGSVSLSRYTISGLERLSQRLGKTMACEDFDVFINTKVEAYLREICQSHADVIKQSGFGLVLGFSCSKNVRLYEVEYDGVPMRMDDNPGYCCIGSGYSSGGSLLMRQFYSKDFDLLQLTRLASYIISQVSAVDPSVGSIAQTKFCFGGKVINPTEELFRERLELRSETIRKVWNFLENDDLDFERSFNKAFEKKKFHEFIKSI